MVPNYLVMEFKMKSYFRNLSKRKSINTDETKGTTMEDFDVKINFICKKCNPNHIDSTYAECLEHQRKVHGLKN